MSSLVHQQNMYANLNNDEPMDDIDIYKNTKKVPQELWQRRQLRLSRSRFRRINSLDLIPEDPSHECIDVALSSVLQPHEKQQMNGPQTLRSPTPMTIGLIRRLLLFWPNLILNLVASLIRYIVFIPLSIAAPSFWLSALLWIFWKLMRIPISCIKWILSSDALCVSSSISSAAQKRTVLISCGSTIQTLHLSRNFYLSGARVVVFEFEGLFGLARFSTAVDKFYVVPRPTSQSSVSVDAYITALCHIVNKEKPSVYIPVCATSPAYYDALAKPHLELLGCASFVPGLQETIALDDCLQFYQRCAAQAIALPQYTVYSSLSDLKKLYEDRDFISTCARNILIAVGMQGQLERYKYILPQQLPDFKFNHEISAQHPWLVVRDLPGDHYVTCTTVKESRVVANVTCKVEMDTKNLIPIVAVPSVEDSTTIDSEQSEEVQIEQWLKRFFFAVRFQRPINGHVSFRLVKCSATKQFLPLGVRLGVSLPYICYNRSHAQVLCRTMKCIHMKQLNLISTDDSESSVLSAISASWRWSSIERSSATAALDKREALFAYWDPLPYCAYYHFQLPLESVKLFLQKRHRSTKSLSPRITMPPVH